MAVKVISGNIFSTSCEYIVNPVNCVGVMGAGLALEFRLRYPEMFLKYEALCKKNMLDVGKLWIYRSDLKNILSFPTKKDWRHSSKVEYLELGLQKFRDTYVDKKIKSIALPLLGSGRGGIDPELSKSIMLKYLEDLNIDIEIYTYKEVVKDDVFELFKSVILGKSVSTISKESKVNMKNVEVIYRELSDGKSCQLSQLLKLKGIGDKTIEKLYEYSLQTDVNNCFL